MKTLKDTVEQTKVYAAYFCSSHETWYIIKCGKTLKLKTLHEIDNLNDQVVTTSLTEIEKIINSFINKNEFDPEIDSFEVEYSYPTCDEGNYQLNTGTFKRFTLCKQKIGTKKKLKK